MLKEEELRNWLVQYIAKITGEPREEIDTSSKLLEYDLDSIDSLRIAVEMEQALGIEVPSDTFFYAMKSLDDIVDQFKSH